MMVTTQTVRLDGKVVVITGSGRGVGAACAVAAARLGARVVLTDIDARGIEQVAASIRSEGGEAIAHEADVTDRRAVHELFEHSVDAFGRLDGVVNNAALMSLGRLEDHDETRLRRLFDVNVVGVFNCAAEALPYFTRQGSGSIVNVTSGAHLGLTDMSDYAATKGAVASATYAWAADLAGTGVRCNALSPIASSAMTRQTETYLSANGLPGVQRELPQPESNAPVVSFLLSDASAGISGQIVRMDGDVLSLQAHPAVMSPLIRHEGWTVDDVATAFDQVLASRQAPVGMAWTDGPASRDHPQAILLKDVTTPGRTDR